MPTPDPARYTRQEAIKHRLLPIGLYMRIRTRKELRRGERELAYAPNLVGRDQTFLDVGANKGIWSWHLARQAGQVHAFEPHPKLFRILTLWRRRNVTAHQIAISDQPGEAELRVPIRSRGFSNQGSSLSTLKVPDSFPHAVVRVEARTLDSYGFDNVGLIKIDVEGHELAVLAGAGETIARCRPNLIVELEETYTKTDILSSVGEVMGYGYDAFFLDKHRILQPIDAFDPETMHRNPADGPSYIFNFIFRPKD